MRDNLDPQKWYGEREPLYHGLLNSADVLLKNILSDKGIHHLPIEKRVKELKSLIEKMDRKGYDTPEQITDLGGLRIIGFILSDTEKIKKVVEDNFEVDVAGKEDKGKTLEKDKVGYLSTHYIASISKNRTSLPEYEKYKDLKFEIQIRTILQHTWAEISHDRFYKSPSELPGKIQREFNLLAAQLEIADREFQRLADEIENHRKHVITQTRKGNLEIIHIDPIAVEGYLSQKFNQEVKDEEEQFDENDIDELDSQGIKSLADLDRMISKETEKYTKLTEVTHKPFSEVVIADIYNSWDKKILFPKFLKALFHISHDDNKICINEMEAYKKMGLGGYGQGIVPYVVADLEENQLVERCRNVGEIRLTEKGELEVKKKWVKEISGFLSNVCFLFTVDYGLRCFHSLS